MSKVPCGGFELDESLALNNGKLGLAPGAGGSQADWNVTDSADSAFIKNKPFGIEKGKLVGTWYYENEPTQNGQGQYVYTFTTSTDDWKLTLIDSTVKIDIIIDGVTYENVLGNASIYSGGESYNFITDGLPFNLTITRLSGNDPDTLTFTYNKSEFIELTIIDKNQTWVKTLDTEYLNMGEIGKKVFPSALDKQHLNYDYGSGKFISSYDTDLKSSTNKIFKLTVDDSGTITATQV